MKKTATLLLAGLVLSSALSTSVQAAAAQSATPELTQATAQQVKAAPVYKAKTPKLNKTQVDRLLAAPEQLVIIDLRRPDELTKIGGFGVYLSIQAKELEQSLAFIPKDRKIVTVSNHAGRAGRGADLLASKGFNVVGAIGAQDYEAEGGTLARVAPPPAKPATGEKAATTATTNPASAKTAD